MYNIQVYDLKQLLSYLTALISKVNERVGVHDPSVVCQHVLSLSGFYLGPLQILATTEHGEIAGSGEGGREEKREGGREGGKGGREGGRERGREGKEGGREGGREGERERREGGMEGGSERGKGGRDGGREGVREGKEGGREGGKEGGRKRGRGKGGERKQVCSIVEFLCTKLRVRNPPV